VLALLVVGCTSCSRGGLSARESFEHANQEFLHGNLKQCEVEAKRGFDNYLHSQPDFAWQFRILEAKAALWGGRYSDVVEILRSVPAPSDRPDLTVPKLTLEGIVDVNTHKFAEAEHLLGDAAKLCNGSDNLNCGYAIQGLGLLASERAESASAEHFYNLSLSFARTHGDSFLEADSLLNLGDESLTMGRFDESIDRSEAGYEVANVAGAEILKLDTKGNIGWAHYRLGDSDAALELFLEAEKRAGDLNDFVDQGAWLTDAGYVYLGDRRFDLAEQAFRKSLEIEKNSDSKEEIYNALRALARLALQLGDLDRASDYAGRALTIARESHNHMDELYPMLVQGQVAAYRGDGAKAQENFEAVENDQACPVFLKWEAERSLARLYEGENDPGRADAQYRAALATFETARHTVQHEDSQLSFLTNAAGIYDDYIHFLVQQKRPDDALQWADYSRARKLAEGLGLLSKAPAKGTQSGAPPLQAREIARQARGTVLFYWLGEKQSYLWAITPQDVHLFTLRPGAEIDAMVQRYRSALNGPQDVLQASEDARALYRTLIEPAKSLLGNDARVFIIPDGRLNNLNFETLVVPEPKPHFWIEDADVVNTSSLRVLAASFAHRSGFGAGKETYASDRDAGTRGHQPARRLLLIGDSVAPSQEYRELPRAAQQMANVAKHFSATNEQIFTRGAATPAAYLASNPAQFSHIHFVAHGTASRLSPLDSAIVLSKGLNETDSFKLYARDIVQHRLSADLVTISACYGAGERAYYGEGLVGLAWAFLGAGAHNVIAGLWEVTDASTEQLMDQFYNELDKGVRPDEALRAAKLSLLHGDKFHNPFYWAPFQLYTGS